MKAYQQLRSRFAVFVQQIKDDTINNGTLKDSELIELLKTKKDGRQQSSTQGRRKVYIKRLLTSWWHNNKLYPTKYKLYLTLSNGC